MRKEEDQEKDYKKKMVEKKLEFSSHVVVGNNSKEKITKAYELFGYLR